MPSQRILRFVLPDQDVGLREQLLRQVVDISLGIDDLLDTGVDEDLGTHRTRICRGVDHRILDADTEIGRLDDSVLLGVYAPA